jgi:hypothetical protein
VLKNLRKARPQEQMSPVRRESGKCSMQAEGFVNSEMSLCLTKHHAMKTYWGVEVQLHAYLTSALDGGEWSALRLGRFYSQ